MSQPLKVLVVDDSALYRKVVRLVLEELPGVEVVGTAANGRFAVERIAQDRPDLITLDFEMPELDGLGVLRQLAEMKDPPAALMVSGLTLVGAQSTNEALRLGAFDFVVKPNETDVAASVAKLRVDLAPKIEACRAARRGRGAPVSSLGKATCPIDVGRRMASSVAALRQKPQIVGIGVSTGGPVALHKVLPRIPADFPLPIVLVQHMPPLFTKSLADDLDRLCPLEVVEGAEGMEVKRGRVVIAPGGKQMAVVRSGGATRIHISDDPPERNCRPAVDYLFRSLAEQFGGRVLGVILTGMGDDGTLGCGLLKRQGARIIAQDEATCVVYGMPRAVYEAGFVDDVVALDQVPDRIVAAVAQGALA